MDYNNDTRNAYRNEIKAKKYQEQYTKGGKWARFTMWRQRVLINKIINQCDFKKTDKILDIPCGTGFIGELLSKIPASIVASDISREMMKRANNEYAGGNFNGFVECDITQTPFRKEAFDCIILLALLHRLPEEIRYKTWGEVVGLSNKFIIVNYSVDSVLQRVKQWLTIKVKPSHKPAPAPMPMQNILDEVKLMKLRVKKKKHIAMFFSSVVILLLEKSDK